MTLVKYEKNKNCIANSHVAGFGQKLSRGFQTELKGVKKNGFTGVKGGW